MKSFFSSIVNFISYVWASVFAGILAYSFFDGASQIRTWLWVVFAIIAVGAATVAYREKNLKLMLFPLVFIVPMAFAGALFSKTSVIGIPEQAVAEQGNRPNHIEAVRKALTSSFFSQ
jgi:hypothetical protein